MDKLDSNRRIMLSPAEESSLAGWLAHQINASERGSTSARRPHPHRDWDARSTTRTCIFVGAWHCFRGSFAAHMWAGESAALLTDEIPVPKGRAPCVCLSVSFVLSFARSRVLSRSFHAPRPIRSGISSEKQKQKQEITRCPPSRPTFRSLSYSPHSSSLRMETRLRHALHMAYSFRRRPYKSNSHSPTGGLGRQRKKVLHMLPTVSELRNTKLHVCVNLWLFLRVQAGIRTSSFVRLQIGFVRCGKAGGRGGIPREGRSLTCAAWEVRRERKGREIGNTMTRRGPNSTNSPAYNPPGPTIRVNTPETQRRSHYINYVIYYRSALFGCELVNFVRG